MQSVISLSVATTSNCLSERRFQSHDWETRLIVTVLNNYLCWNKREVSCQLSIFVILQLLYKNYNVDVSIANYDCKLHWLSTYIKYYTTLYTTLLNTQFQEMFYSKALTNLFKIEGYVNQNQDYLFYAI